MSSFARTIQRRIMKRRKVAEVPVFRRGDGKIIGTILPLYIGQTAR